MGCICSKGIRANEYVQNSLVNELDSPKTSKRLSLSLRKDNGEAKEADCDGNEATTRLISGNAENADASPCSSGEDRKKKLDLEPIVERKPSKPPGLSNLAEGMTEANVMSVQARVTRLTSVSNGERGARVVAGWPSWLVAVAGEAINGWIPRKADSFEKLEKIGQGTYSSVYKARDLESDKIVALKKVRFASMDLESVRFMAREIVILRRLDHPNVMKLEGIITSRVSGSLYLVFEYMDHDLAGLAAAPEIKFSEAQIKCYLKQLFHGLEHCHSRGILHRDIKGSNLLIDHNNNLKIGDFGLANFCRPIQKQPLTSRVVTLWYRPPELLLGSTDYGVSVDLWSSGCILAELFTGKPIMPGRTEVEQLHKIFKLCGSPSEEYWKSSRLRHATIFKPQQPYKRSVAETFKDITSSALALLEALLSVEPDRRGTASSALQSEFFTTKPFPSDSSSLPKYPPRKEFDTKLREEEARRRKGGGKGRDETKRGYGDSKAVPAPDANAELQASILKRKMLSNTKSVSEKFTAEEESGAGFPIEPSNRTTQDLYSHSALSMSSTTAFESSANMKANGDDALAGPSQKRPSPRKDLRTHRSYGRNGATQLSRFSNSVAVRDRSEFGSLRDTNSNWHEERIKGKYDDLDGGQSSENYDWSHRLLDKPNHLPKDEQPSGKEPLAYGTKMGRMHYSGPLLPAGGNIEEMLKEHERQIRLAVRRARDKANSHKASNADHNGLTESLLGEEDGIGRL